MPSNGSSEADGMAVEVADLRKEFGPSRALDGVDLAIPERQFVALFGPNGSGKTTLVRILSTLSRPSAGEVRLFGRPLPRAGPGIRRRLGVVSHVPFLNAALSPRENLSTYASLFDVPDARSRAEECLRLVGLTHRADDPVRGFSRGLTQRCAIARALLHDPDLLLLDEPFAGLDPDAADRLTRILRDDRGRRTVLLTSHELARGAGLADRVIILRRGRVIHDDAIDRVPDGDVAALYRRTTGGGR